MNSDLNGVPLAAPRRRMTDLADSAGAVVYDAFRLLFGDALLAGFYIKLRILYDLFFYDSAVEGSFWTYVSARIGDFARNHWGREMKRPASERIVIKNRLGVFEIDASNDTLTKSCPYFEHWLHGWIPPAGKTFVDIGANIGLYSLLALKSRGYENAIAFEPNPATYATLSKNIRLNALEGRMTAEKLALGSSNAQLLMRMERHHTGASRIVAQKNVDPVDLVPVAQTTLDAYVDEHGIDPAQISYLKVDVEGFEHQTMRGASATLVRMSRGSRVQVEVWGSQRRKHDVLGLLAEAGFTMVDAAKPTTCSKKDDRSAFDHCDVRIHRYQRTHCSSPAQSNERGPSAYLKPQTRQNRLMDRSFDIAVRQH